MEGLATLVPISTGSINRDRTEGASARWPPPSTAFSCLTSKPERAVPGAFPNVGWVFSATSDGPLLFSTVKPFADCAPCPLRLGSAGSAAISTRRTHLFDTKATSLNLEILAAHQALSRDVRLIVRLSVVICRVPALGLQHKIFWSVVRLDLVLVVRHFTIPKKTAQLSFQNQPMLVDIPTSVLLPLVPRWSHDKCVRPVPHSPILTQLTYRSSSPRRSRTFGILRCGGLTIRCEKPAFASGEEVTYQLAHPTFYFGSWWRESNSRSRITSALCYHYHYTSMKVVFGVEPKFICFAGRAISDLAHDHRRSEKGSNLHVLSDASLAKRWNTILHIAPA